MVNSIDLESRINASQYLSGLVKKYPTFLGMANSIESSPPITHLKRICQTMESLIEGNQELENLSSLADLLIRTKAEFSFCWSLAEFLQDSEYAVRGELQTRFAELTIELALKISWQELAKKHRGIELALTANEGSMPGLFVFGMGKLGGRDLNFSSDIDLVAYFDPEALPVPDVLGKSYICHQVLQRVTQTLVQNKSSEFIWRVDWRLRPNASATTLAMSTEAAAEYYYFRASPWHRLALMKARVVAGDKLAGQCFLDKITPFIWRQNLDYRAIDELAEIKNRINLEHPTLKVERQWREPINDDVSGFNVKLGAGGIREIEFVTNALQLLWGGKHYRLRTSNTLEAISALCELEHFDVDLAESLKDAYMNLRGIENAIQILGNQHTHLVPKEQVTQTKLLSILGKKHWQAFVDRLNASRRIVSAQFEALFADQGVADFANIEWPSELSSAATDIVESWENGFHLYGVSQNVRQKLKPLSSALANYLSDFGELDSAAMDQSKTVIRLHEFFRSLPQGEQYFRLLAESPQLLNSIVPPLLYSPAMSTLLSQSPHIIDCYMSSPLELNAPFDSDYIMQAQQYEIRLERMRRFVNEHLYQLYLLFLQGRLEVKDFQSSLSALAEHTLGLALKVVAQNMNLDDLPIAVLGMGKVALRRMSPLSDLDLIFIYDQERMSLELATKFVSRLQTAIAAPMREGIVYELDTRLRPSGKSGAPIVSIESFATHQLQRAHTWEHIALVPSRVVAGDLTLLEPIHQVKREVLQRSRNETQFLNDAQFMWNRVSEHRLQEHDSSVMFSKLRPGGLMQSEYLTACMLLSNTMPTVSGEQSIEFDQLISMGSRTIPRLTELSDAMEFWRIQQLWERLLGFTEQPLDALPAEYLERLLDQSGAQTLSQLVEKKTSTSAMVLELMEQFFAQYNSDRFDYDAWVERNVQWES